MSTANQVQAIGALHGLAIVFVALARAAFIFVVLAISALHGLAIVFMARAFRRVGTALAIEPRRAEVFEGVAATMILAVCAALFLTGGTGFGAGILAWLGFVAMSGACIWLPRPPRFDRALGLAAAPGGVLLLVSLAICLFPWWFSTPSREPPLGVLIYTLFVGLLAVPAIALASTARGLVVGFGRDALTLDLDQLGRVEKVANTAIRIAATVAGVLLVVS